MAYQLSYEYESLKHDVRTLFSRFNEKQSARFEDFCAEWRAMNFSCIFAATYRNTLAAKMRIVERLYRVSSEFLSEESTFLYRVAAVYMFYTVYFKQISDQKVKIRMTPTMWKDLMDFLSIVIEHRHLDVAYVIQTLRRKRAFIFTAFPKYLLLGRHEFMLGIEGMTGLRQTYESDRYFNDLLSNQFINKVRDIQKEYYEVKLKVLNESKEDEIPYLSKVLFYANPEFPVEFKNILDGYRKRHETGSSLKPDLFDSSQRPILTPLQEIHHGIPEDPDKEPVVKKVSSFARIKEKAWKASVNFSEKKKPIKDEELNENVTKKGDTIYYRKSAMLQPKVMKKKKANYAKGIRYLKGYTKAED